MYKVQFMVGVTVCYSEPFHNLESAELFVERIGRDVAGRPFPVIFEFKRVGN